MQRNSIVRVRREKGGKALQGQGELQIVSSIFTPQQTPHPAVFGTSSTPSYRGGGVHLTTFWIRAGRAGNLGCVGLRAPSLSKHTEGILRLAKGRGTLTLTLILTRVAPDNCRQRASFLRAKEQPRP